MDAVPTAPDLAPARPGRQAPDLSRLRRVAFEVQLVLSFLTAINSATSESLRFFEPESASPMRVLLLGWAALHPLFFWAGRRLRATAVHFAFLLAASLVLQVAFTQVTGPLLGSLGMRLAYLGATCGVGLVLLPVRLAALLGALVAGSQVIAMGLEGHPAPPMSSETLYSMGLPALVCGGMLVLAAWLVERLQRRLEEQNARLEAQVAERTAVIERQQAALLQAQKLEAVGTLAAGLAHDFNNLMAVILGFARELRLYAEPGDPVGPAADVIDASARRAADLTQRLLGFARQGKVLDVPLDLHQAVDGVLAMVSRNLGGAIRVEKRLAAERPFVLGDPVQVQQVLVNLVLNARDAMPTGGTLTLETRQRALSGHPELPDGTYVELAVRDTGAGIPAAIRERVFDPFFTTKRPGEGSGSGLGLAMVYGIVKAHQGAIAVESEEGRGTAMRVLLPETSQRPAAQSSPPARRDPTRGALLVLGDDEAITGLAQRVRALLAAQATARPEDWLEARAFVQAHARDLELIFLDRGRA